MNRQIIKRSKRLQALLSVSIASSFAALFAQSVEQEVFELSPFEVDASQDTGYAATNTLSGSRMNTALRDTPVALSVFTREFLDDLGATSVEEMLAYDINAVPEQGDSEFDGNGNQNGSMSDGFSYRSRGLGGTVSTDGFRGVGFGDNYNVERIGSSRGPNAILFGTGSAGGTINLRTKRANANRDSNELEFKVGEYDTKRAAFDFNRVIMEDKLGIRIMGVYDHKGDHKPWEFRETYGLTIAANYKLSEKTGINVSWEKSEIEGIGSRAGAPVDRASQFVFAEQAGQLVWDPNQERYETLTGSNAGGDQGVGNVNRRNVIVYSPDFSTVDLIEGTAANSNYSTRASNSSFHNVSNGNDNPSNLEHFGVPLGSVSGTGFSEFGEEDVTKFTASLTQNLMEGMYLELSVNDSMRQTDGILAGNPQLNVDLTRLLPDGSVNPYWYGNGEGYYFMESHYIRLGRIHDNDTLRAALSYEKDFGERWGFHRFALMVEDHKAYELRDRDREVWADRPNGGNADVANNRVYRRHYFQLDGPKEQIAVGGSPDMRISETFDSIYHGDLNTAWVGANNRDAGDEVSTKTNMIVMQNYLFNRRLVTTFGYRDDDLTIEGPLTIRDPDTTEWRFATPDDDPALIGQYNSGRQDWNLVSNESAEFLTTGAVFHLTKNFALTANSSDGIQLPERNRNVLPDDVVPSPFDGQGTDYGVSFSFNENAISGSLKYFESSTLRESTGGSLAQDVFVNPNNDILQSFAWYFEDQGITDLTPAGIGAVQGNPVNSTEALVTTLESGADAYLFDNLSEGYEFELLANVTDNWIVRFNYSYTTNTRTNVLLEGVPWWAERRALFNDLDSYYISATGDTSVFDKMLVDADGVEGSNSVASRVADSDSQLALNRAEQENGFGVRPNKANIWTRYSFNEGRLKGLTIGGGYRYQQGNVAGVDLINNTKLIGNPSFLADFMASYRTKGFFGKGNDNHRVTYQVNVSNLLDEDTLISTKIFTDTVTNEPFGKRVYRTDPRKVSFTIRTSF